MLRRCQEARVAVTARGLGSGVVGGAVAYPGGLVLDLSDMTGIVSFDEGSSTITVRAGMRGADLENYLNEREDMFTVRRLGLSGTLAGTLTTTNCIEAMISVARTTMRNVKHWQDGEMKKRLLAAGMAEAQRSFRRVVGYRQMPVLVAALRRHAGIPVTPPIYDQQAA